LSWLTRLPLARRVVCRAAVQTTCSDLEQALVGLPAARPSGETRHTTHGALCLGTVIAWPSGAARAEGRCLIPLAAWPGWGRSSATCSSRRAPWPLHPRPAAAGANRRRRSSRSGRPSGAMCGSDVSSTVCPAAERSRLAPHHRDAWWRHGDAGTPAACGPLARAEVPSWRCAQQPAAVCTAGIRAVASNCVPTAVRPVASRPLHAAGPPPGTRLDAAPSACCCRR